MSVRPFYLIALAATLGCATTSGTAGAGGRGNHYEQGWPRQRLEAGGASELRPISCAPRPSSLRTDVTSLPTVYVGRQKYGDATTLRQIPINTIALIRFYTASEATLTYGMDNPNGVIEVTLKAT